MKNKYPKILIIGETFRANCGGGITLMSLFGDWPKDHLAVVTDKTKESNFSVCNNYYQISSSKIVKPRHKPDGVVTMKPSKTTVLSRKYRPLAERIRFLLVWFFGLGIILDRVKVTRDLAAWVEKFNPDVIYIQPLFYRENKLALDLLGITKARLAVHFTDNSFEHPTFQMWPLWIFALLSRKTLTQLLDKSNIGIAISQQMSEVFGKKFGKNFFVFRNAPERIINPVKPIDDKHNNSNIFRIIYTGSLAEMYKTPLEIFVKALEKLNDEGISVKLDIFSQAIHQTASSQLKGKSFVKINNPIVHSKIPNLLSSYDLILFVSSFDEKAREFVRYSFSTRTFENMLSGTPVFLYAPEDCSQYKYAKKTHSAILASKTTDIYHVLKNAILDSKTRKTVAKNALVSAIKDNNPKLIRENFREILSQR